MSYYSGLYDLAYDKLLNIVNDFLDKPLTNQSVNSFLSAVSELESYLNYTYEKDITHLAISSSLHEICKEKSCLEIWNTYNFL